MATYPKTNWRYHQESLRLPDPRQAISKHMDWATPINRGLTPWLGIEPDNYNLAVYDDRPHDFKFMEHQCFYQLDTVFLRQRLQGWFSVYVATERLQTILFNREMLKIQPQAVWRYAHAKLIREKRVMLNREQGYSNRADDNFSTEERLYQMGYYEKLKNKYFSSEEKFIAVVGRPRGAVLNYRPEADSIVDYYDE